jgi:hypothetical protein
MLVTFLLQKPKLLMKTRTMLVTRQRTNTKKTNKSQYRNIQSRYTEFTIEPDVNPCAPEG